MEERIKEVIKIEIPHWQNGGTNFTSKLLTLIQTADPSNKFKLSQVFPAEVEALKRWEEMNIDSPEVDQLVGLINGMIGKKP